MGVWNSLVMLSLVAASAWSSPLPDTYNIPDVGNNERSQYYVLHDDGSFKYGYDTGADAFESLKTNAAGESMGRFGYRDDDGQQYSIEYTSGSGGFVARGDHIPQVHPDVAAAFEAARSAGPFVDPLADSDGDRSYNFEFDGEEHSRNEVSDSDGTVRGSYSYIDEFGRTRTYTYRAGKGIGFVIEGDDIPQQVQPLPTHTTTTQFGASQRTSSQAASQRQAGHRAAASHGASAHGAASRRTSSSRATQTAASQRAASHGASFSTSQRATQTRKVAKPATTYFPPTPSTRGSSASSRAQTSFSSQQTRVQSARPQPARQQPGRPVTRTSSATRQFEAANTRTSQSPSGSYSLAYETSSHSRQESGDDDNNVRGHFRFVADDDGEDREIEYEAGSATGFIAQGQHLPIGPIVPGAPTGQVTGRIVPVQEIPFVDPLADSGLDASFDFGFDSETYSRSETADEDGNVVGTYSVLGEDGVLRTYRYRAGKGIGFETEEISAVAGQRRSGSSVSSASQSHRQASAGTGSVRAVPSLTYNAPSVSAHSAHGSAAGAHTSRVSTGSNRASTRGHSSAGSRSSFSSSSSASHGGGNIHRAGFKSSSSSDERFTLRTYDPSEGRGKYGYVLKFDD